MKKRMCIRSSRSVCGLITAITACGWFAASQAMAGEIYVSTNATPQYPYNTWDIAFTNVQDAIDAAAASGGATETIYLAGHTFWLTNQIEWTTAGLTIIGGHAATNTADQPGLSDPEQWPTVLARSGAGGSHRVMWINGANNSTLEHVTLTGGNVVSGAGLRIDNSQNVLLSGCIIEENAFNVDARGATTIVGAGIRAGGSSVTLTNCVVQRNTAQNRESSSTHGRARGAGIWSDGTLTIIDSVIRDNILRAVRCRGGGIYFTGTTLTMRNVLLTGNGNTGRDDGITANDSYGDGLYVAGGAANLFNVTLTDHNEAIRRVGGSINITDSIIWGNSLTNLVGSNITADYSNIGDAGYATYGANNMNADPRFEYGYYLQDGSPCIGQGSDTADNRGLTAYTTRIDGAPYDSGAEDVTLGYHALPGTVFDLAYADIYVVPSGDDGHSGTNAAKPFQTMTKALSMARDGSRIHLAPGHYGVETSESFPLELSSRTHVQILGADATNTIFDAGMSGVRVMWLRHCHRSLLKNVTITGGNEPYGIGLRSDFSHHMAIENCIVTNNSFSVTEGSRLAGGGLYLLRSNVTIDGCLISGNTARNDRSSSSHGAVRGGGIWSDGMLLVQNSFIHDNHVQSPHNAPVRGAGINFQSGTDDLYRLTLRNVLFAENETDSSAANRRGAGLHVQRGMAAVDNVTVTDNNGHGIYREGGTINLLNGIVWDNDGDDIVGAVYASHSLYGTGANVVDEGDNIIDDDPLFEDAGAGDYRLQQESPAIDAGLNQPWMAGATDLGGLPRIMKGIVDMGCYESIPPSGTLILLR